MNYRNYFLSAPDRVHRVSKIVSRLLVAGVFFALLLQPFSGRALTFGPTVLDVAGDPGKTVDVAFQVKNTEAAGAFLRFSTMNFTSKDETGVPNFVDDSNVSGLSSWIRLPEEGVFLKPGQEMRVRMDIDIPANALAGGYYASILIEPILGVTEPVAGRPVVLPPAGSKNVQVQSKGAILVMLRVSGDITQQFSVHDFLSSGSIVSGLPVDFSYRVTNAGGVHIRPYGFLDITNLFGRQVAHIPANTESGAVLPGTVRRFVASWGETANAENTENTDHQESFLGDALREWKDFTFGRYTATLTLSPDEKEPKGETGPSSTSVTTSSTSVLTLWVIPYHLFVLLGGVLLLGGAIIFFTGFLVRRSMRRRQKR